MCGPLYPLYHFFPRGLPTRYALILSLFRSAVLVASCSSCLLWRCHHFLRRWRPIGCACSGKQKGWRFLWLLGALALHVSPSAVALVVYIHTFCCLRRHICARAYLLLFLCPWVLVVRVFCGGGGLILFFPHAHAHTHTCTHASCDCAGGVAAGCVPLNGTDVAHTSTVTIRAECVGGCLGSTRCQSRTRINTLTGWSRSQRIAGVPLVSLTGPLGSRCALQVPPRHSAGLTGGPARRGRNAVEDYHPL